MIVLTSMIAAYTLFYDAISVNETMNRAALFILVIYASMSLMWRFRAVLFD